MTIGPRPAHLALALDNDVLNDWRARRPTTLQAVNAYIAAAKVPPALTSATVFEMMHGFERAAVLAGGMTDRIRLDVEHARALTRDCVVLPFNQEAAEVAAYIFARLSKSQRNQHWGDVFIAATALVHEYGVATRNGDDFRLIADHMPLHYPALRIQIWK